MISELTAAQCLEKRWFVMHVSRMWRQAEQWLADPEKGLEHFIPRQVRPMVRAGKPRLETHWAIPGYLFIHATQREIVEFKKAHNQITFVSWTAPDRPTRYLMVDDRQMADFIRVSTSEQPGLTYLAPEQYDLSAGQRVRIIGGPFDGVDGHFIRLKGKRNRRLVVALDDFYGISAEIAPSLIQLLPD